MTNTIDVLVFLNKARETTNSLKIASEIDEDDISIHLCSFFKPDDDTFGCEVTSLDADSQFDMVAYRRLYSMLKEESPDVFHVHPNATGSIARVLAKVAGVPHIVTTEHNNHNHFSHLKNLINGGTNWLNDAVVCNSRSTADSFSRWEDTLLSIGKTRKDIVYNGVDVGSLEKAILERTPPQLPDKFIFGTAARLVHQKNLRSIIEAISRVDSRDDIYIAIVGTGPKKDHLKSLAYELEVDVHVEFLGYLPERADVYTFLDEIDVFLFPSFYEGFGVAVVEAMATGTPVIVNDIPVLREVVGDCGLFVDATDYDELASAMEEVYLDYEKRQKLGHKAEKRAKDKFSLEKTVEGYTDIYRQLHN